MRVPQPVVIAMASVAGAGIAYEMPALMLGSPEARNADVAHCAANLGKTTVVSANIPEGCEPFEQVLGFTRTEVTTYAPTEEGTREEDLRHVTTKEYTLPDAKSFTEERTVTPADLAEEQEARAFMAASVGVSGLMMALGIHLMVSGRKKRYEKPQRSGFVDL